MCANLTVIAVNVDFTSRMNSYRIFWAINFCWKNINYNIKMELKKEEEKKKVKNNHETSNTCWNPNKIRIFNFCLHHYHCETLAFFHCFRIKCTNYFTNFILKFKYLNHIAWNDMLMWDESVCIITTNGFVSQKVKAKSTKIFLFSET